MIESGQVFVSVLCLKEHFYFYSTLINLFFFNTPFRYVEYLINGPNNILSLSLITYFLKVQNVSAKVYRYFLIIYFHITRVIKAIFQNEIHKF